MHVRAAAAALTMIFDHVYSQASPYPTVDLTAMNGHPFSRETLLQRSQQGLFFMSVNVLDQFQQHLHDEALGDEHPSTHIPLAETKSPLVDN
jgi:hypothetical protein